MVERSPSVEQRHIFAAAGLNCGSNSIGLIALEVNDLDAMDVTLAAVLLSERPKASARLSMR